MIVFRYTKHQVARGARADAETPFKLFLLKNVSELRLTYQIRLLAFRAQQTNRKLVIQTPKHCKVHGSLRTFANSMAHFVRLEKV
jgi:hypothetical protein